MKMSGGRPTVGMCQAVGAVKMLSPVVFAVGCVGAEWLLIRTVPVVFSIGVVIVARAVDSQLVRLRVSLGQP